MQHGVWRHRWWIVGATIVMVTGAVLIARQTLAQQRALFETDARIMHRLLSQRAVQHDAILATLTLLQPAAESPDAMPPERRLPALYPHILSVRRRNSPQPWNDPAFEAAEAQSRRLHHPALAAVDFRAGRYEIVLAAEPNSFALSIDLNAMVPTDEWPMNPQASPVRVALEHAGRQFQLQAGNDYGVGSPLSQFEFRKQLAASSQPFEVVVQRQLDWLVLPWWWMLAWTLAVAVVLAAVAQLRRQRVERRRAEEWVRLGQVARLNTLGELAAGLAHELNQPLTAVLANTQAAQRLLADDPPELTTAREAMAQAATQARRAADVVGRLRGFVERPEIGEPTQRVNLNEAARRALHLLEPECKRHMIEAQLQADAAVTVRADPVALEQVVHNLLMNALQALELVDTGKRVLTLRTHARGLVGELVVSDNGPGIAPDVMPRLFHPFFSTRKGGLGLGLSLCETLTSAMGGALTADNGPHGGAVFTLSLPLHASAP